jgi:ABC-2 type transport system ATP-binding protein
VIERGTPIELKRRVGGEQIEVVVTAPRDAPAAIEALSSFACGDAHVERDGRSVVVPVRDVAGIVPLAVRRLDEAGIDIDDVGVRRSTLDDVFFALTGHAADVDGNGSADGDRAASESEDHQVPESRTPGRMRPAPPVTDPDANREEEPAR